MAEADHKQTQQSYSTERAKPEQATLELSAEVGAIHPILHLQRTIGNQAVLRLLGVKDEQPQADPIERARHAAVAPPSFLPESAGEALDAGQVQWKKHKDFPAVMGQTYYARMDIEMWPSFNLKVERSIWPWGYAAKPNKTDSLGAVWPSIATPESEEGYKIPHEHPNHPGYEYYVRESGQAANIIATAEQQHLNDLDQGWDITGNDVRRAINQAADEEPDVRDDPQAAKKAAVDKVVGKLGALGEKIRGALEGGGRLEDALGPMMDNAFVQSKAKRDETGKHTLGVRYVMTDDQKNAVLYEVNEDFQLDTTSSESIVNIGTIGG